MGTMGTMIQCRSVVIAAYLAGTFLVTTGPNTLLTVDQSDPFRSPRAPGTADVSADGRSVAFESLAQLVPADTDKHRDIYVLDRTSGRVTLETAALGDGGEYSHPRISGDGRYLVFESRPTVLDRDRAAIVLSDRLTGATRVLTGNDAGDSPIGWSRCPEISDDGRVVAFSSASTALTGGRDANGPLEDVYVVRLPAGTITRVSVNSAGVQPDRGNSILPSLSADGRWVAFASTALFDDDARPATASREKSVRQVYLRDLVSGRTTRVTRAANRALPDGDSSIPAISADGRHVVFVSEASNLLDDDDNRVADVFLYDREADGLTWVSRAADGSSAGGESTWPAISGNGRFVAFQSDAANLVCAARNGACSPPRDPAAAQAVGAGPRAPRVLSDDVNLIWDVFVFDRTSGLTVRVSEDELGGWMEASVGPALDATGQVVAFSSRHAVAAADRGVDFDLFVRALTPPAPVKPNFP
jgi:Tol biopolymer transport system component